MEYLTDQHPEWPTIWQQLGSNPINAGDYQCLNDGQHWQYMGSSDSHHHFRHHCHPLTGRAEYIYLERSDHAPEHRPLQN